MMCKQCGQSFEAEKSEFCCSGCESAYRISQKEMSHQTGVYTIESFLGTDGQSYVFFAPDLKCASCIWLVKKVLNEIEFVSSVDVDLSERCVTVRFESDRLQPEFVVAALRKIGYIVYPAAERFNSQTLRAVSRMRMKQLGIAGVAFANVMLMSTALYFSEGDNIDERLRHLFLWGSFAVTLGSLWVTARPLFVNAFQALKHRKLHVDLPILFAMAVAFVFSVWNLFQGSSEVYFDSITGLLFFLLVGRALHDNLLERARKLSQAAPSALPVRASEVNVNDVILVAPGEVFPADGVVLSGVTEVNEALLTGESMPVEKKSKDIVFAGTQNILGSVTMKVEFCQEQTKLWQVLRAIEEAARNKTIFQTMIDRILPWFVTGTMLLASLGFFIWAQTDLVMASKVFVTVLIVCCPCALALALPMASSFYLRRAWKHGVLIKSPDALERLSKITAVVLDKTRTITTGQITILRTLGAADDSFYAKVFAVARQSQHPISQALSKWLKGIQKCAPVSKVIEEPGKGIRGEFPENCFCSIGKPDWILSQLSEVSAISQFKSLQSETPKSDVVWATDGKKVAVFCLQDSMRPEAPELFALWRSLALPTFLASGDTQKRVIEFAQALEIPSHRAFGDLTPQGKLKLVESLQRDGHRVLFIGDGMNDAGAAQAASVSIAVGGSIDIAVASSDVAFESASLLDIENLRTFSRYSVSTLRLLLAASVLYNAIAVGLAFSGILHPLVAALIMPVASITILSLCLFRKGDHLWKCSSSSCPSPSPLHLEQHTSFGAQPIRGNGTI